MRVRCILGIASLLVLLAITTFVHADDCAYRDGGYCVAFIAKETAKKLSIPTETAMWGQSRWNKSLWATDVAMDGTNYLNYYENLWDQMVKNGKATIKDRETTFEEAKKAGGTKIGGVNLVVLAAKTLQHLVDKGALTKEEAQGILNRARSAAQ